MADTKITALAAIATVDPAADVLPIVDISDTSMAASGTTKKITSNQILQSGGVATLASATITGALTVGTTLGVTGASSLSGVVTVSAGATTPLDITNAAVTTERQIKIANSTVTAYLGVEPAAGGRFLGSAANNAYFGTNSAFGLEFATSNNVRMTLNTTGNLAFANGLGIDFSAKTPDGSGTLGSEVLNDYEEGTWTPAYSPTSGAFTTLPTVGSGRYRKIGDTVFFWIDLRTAGTVVLGTASGDIQITGFPFTCSSAGGYGSSSLFQQFNLASTSSHLGILITASTTIARIPKNSSNSAASYVQANELSTATGNFENLLGAFGMYNV